MYNISNDYKIACKQITRQSRTKVVIDGVTYDGSKYIKDYPKFSHSNEKMIGGFPIKSAEFSLWIKDSQIDIINKEIKIYRGLLVNTEIIWIPQGVFYAQDEDVTTSDTGEYISVKCYDKAKEAGTKTYIDNNVYPISETNYIKNVINQSGYELDENVFVESNYMMKQKPNMDSKTSVREIISRYAEQRGAVALFSRLGKVQIKRPTEIDFLYKFYEYKKLTCESTYGPLNQVILGNKNINNNVVWPIGEQTYPWTINDNPFLDLFKLDRNQEVYNQLKDLELTPFTLESALDVFYLDINDVITIEKKDKTLQKVTILSIETENRLKCKIGANVQNKNNIDYNLAGSLKSDINNLQFDVDYNKNQINALVSTTTEQEKQIEEIRNPIKEISGNNHLCLYEALENGLVEYKIYGKCVKEKESSLENPSEIQTIKGTTGYLKIHHTNKESEEESTNTREYLISLKETEKFHELCEINDFRDELNVLTGQLNKKIGKIILDGNNEDAYTYISGNSNDDFIQINYASKMISNIDSRDVGTNVLCSHFDYYEQATTNHKSQSGIRLFNTDLFVFSVPTSIAKNGSDFKIWLRSEYAKGTPVTIYYLMNEEKQIQLEPAQISLFEGENHLELEEGIETDTYIKYQKKTAYNEIFYTKTETQAELNLTKEEISQKVSETESEIRDDLKVISDEFAEIKIKSDEITNKVSAIYDLTSEKSSSNYIEINNAQEGNLIEFRITGKMSLLYPDDELYPDDDLYLLDTFLNVENENGEIRQVYLPIDYLKKNGDLSDEFIIEQIYNNDTNKYDSVASIIRRVDVSKEQKIRLETLEILLFKGYNKIYLESFENLNYSIKYVATNSAIESLENVFAKKAEMNSVVKQTQNSILEEVNAVIEDLDIDLKAKFELKVDIENLISEINASADEIDIEGNRIRIKSLYFELTKDGKIYATSGKVGGFELSEDKLTCEIKPPVKYTDSDIEKIRQIMLGNISATNEDMQKYDFDKNGIINSADLLRCRQMIVYNLSNQEPGKLILDTNDWYAPIKFVNGSGKIIVSLGPTGVYTAPYEE